MGIQFRTAPTPDDHLLMRAVLTANTLASRTLDLGSGAHFRISEELWRIVTGAFVQNSVEALRTLTLQTRFGHSLLAGALLRLQLECLITTTWIVNAGPDNPNCRLARVLVKTINEQKRRATSDGATDDPFLAKTGRYLLDHEELRDYRNEKPAPNVRDMATDVDRTELYQEYRRWSSEMHAGLGMHVRECHGTLILDRILRLLAGVEYLYNLVYALSPSVAGDQQVEYADILNTLAIEYVLKLQDAFKSADSINLFADDEARLTKVLADRCSCYRTVFSDSASAPNVIAADAVRGAWEKSGCISVRFKNIGTSVVTLQARVQEDPKRAMPRWWRPWHHSVEKEVGKPPTRLLPQQSGYLTFPAPPPTEKLISLHRENQPAFLAICERPYAGLQNTTNSPVEVVTVDVTCVIEGKKSCRYLQPLIVH